MSAADENDLHYVPALPGYDVLTYLPDDKSFDALPVAAWVVLTSDEGFAIAMPVTTGRPVNLNDDPVVRLPDGTVACGDMVWMTDAEWLADMIAGKPATSPNITINTGAPNVLSLEGLRRKLQAE